jgi:hypothetical protein
VEACIYFEQFDLGCRAHASYIDQFRQVVDPRRDVELYIGEARKNDLRIGHVIETQLVRCAGFHLANRARSSGANREEAGQAALRRAFEMLARTCAGRQRSGWPSPAHKSKFLSPPMLESH